MNQEKVNQWQKMSINVIEKEKPKGHVEYCETVTSFVRFMKVLSSEYYQG